MKRLAGLLIALVFSTNLWSAEELPSEPQQVIDSAASKLLKRLEKTEEANESEELVLDLVQEIILPIVDQRQTARLTMGKHWKAASEVQRNEFLNGFKALLIKTYASAFTSLKGQKVDVEYEGTKFNKKGNKAIVRSKILLPKGGKVVVDYRLFKKNDSWWVYDAAVEGLGIVKTYRNQFDQAAKSKGIDQAMVAMFSS